MTPKERILISLKHEQPDFTPYHISFTKKAHRKMVEYYNDHNFLSKIGNHFYFLDTKPADDFKEIKINVFIDQFGVLWDRSIDKDIGVVCNQVINKSSINEYKFPDPSDPSRFSGYQQIIKKEKDLFLISNLGFSLFERAWTLFGMENLLMAMVDDKDFTNILFDRILEFNLGIINKSCSFEIDAMMFGDDWGQQNGLIMGPKLWREFIKPRIRIMYEAVKSKGKYVFIHSCGKVDELFPDLIECGLDLFNPFQPEVMNVFEIKKKFGKNLSFFGGISTQRTLPFENIENTKKEVRKLISEIGLEGGYIASPAHDIPADAKAENIAAMIEVLQNQ